MDVKYTPGPWQLGPDTGMNDSGTIMAGKTVIVHDVFGRDSDEARENAVLIAAAPDLLRELERTHAALIAIRKHILPHVPDQTRDFHEEIDAAAAAISKAKGA